MSFVEPSPQQIVQESVKKRRSRHFHTGGGVENEHEGFVGSHLLQTVKACL